MQRQTLTTVGASLLAMTVCQSTSMLIDPPLSRAGSLPQGLVKCLRAVSGPSNQNANLNPIIASITARHGRSNSSEMRPDK